MNYGSCLILQKRWVMEQNNLKEFAELQKKIIEQQVVLIKSFQNAISSNKKVVFSLAGLDAIISLLNGKINGKASSRVSKAIFVFLYLVRHMGLQNSVIIKYQYLQEALNCKRTTIYVSLKTLEDANILEKEKTAAGVLIHINDELCWRLDSENAADIRHAPIPILTKELLLQSNQEISNA